MPGQIDPNSISAKIRGELSKDFDAPAQAVVAALAKKGIHIDSQQVHQVRSAERKRRASRVRGLVANPNERPLQDFINDALADGAKVTWKEIATRCTNIGYKYTGQYASYVDNLRRKLDKMVGRNELVQEGELYFKPPQPATAAPVAHEGEKTVADMVMEAAATLPERKPVSDMVAARAESLKAEISQAEGGAAQFASKFTEVYIVYNLAKKLGGLKALKDIVETIEALQKAGVLKEYMAEQTQPV